MEEVKPGRIYRHYKGDYYIVKCLARNNETDEQMVIYQALYDAGEIWCRPLEIFLEALPENNIKANGLGQMHRFELQQIKSAREKS